MTTNAMNSKTLEDRYLLPTYAKLPISIERGEGSYVYDTEGNRYLDMYGGHCVSSTGHCHPHIVKAIRDQLENLIFYSNATYNSMRGKAAEKLISLSHPHYQVFFANSGAETNENAIKLARALTGRSEFISTTNAFHGRTYGSLSATGISKYRGYLNTPVPGHKIVPLEVVIESVSESTAGVLLEPIQSMGGIVETRKEILEEIRVVTKKHGALLIFDEIQTGIGRTGSFLYSQGIGIDPDMTTLAKGIASGFPAGALLLTERWAKKVSRGDLGSTFGGNPLASVAILATLQVLTDQNLMQNAQEVGSFLKDALLKLPIVSSIRGRGLLVGIEFANRSAKEVQQELLKRRILSGTSNDPQVLRLMPPLTLSREDVEFFVMSLESL